MKQGVIIFLFILLLGAFNSPGQDFNFKGLTTSDGLSNSWVRCFYQDDLGFVWVGTSDGLNRYDGQNFKVYRPLSDRNFSMGNIAINDIIQKDEENLWIASDIGLFTFNMLSEEMVFDTLLPPHPILVIVKEKEAIYWFGTNRGLFAYNSTSKLKTHYQDNGNPSIELSHEYINTLTIDSNENLWIGTKNGLTILDRSRQNCTIYKNSGQKESISGNDIIAFHEDEKHGMWIGTALNGLNLATGTSNTLQFEKVVNGNIRDLQIDNKNQLWIAHSSEEGIHILDLTNFNQNRKNIRQLNYDALNINTIGDNSVFSIFTDQLNDIWIGTFGNGVSYFSYRTKPFYNVGESSIPKEGLQNSLVNTFYDEEEFLWIGTEGGLDRLNKATGKYKHFGHRINQNNSLASNPVLSIQKDSRGNLWVGTWAGGLNLFNYETETFKRFLPDGKKGSIGSGNVFRIYEDYKNNLWIGTNAGGLNLYDYETETFKVYKNIPSDTSSLGGRSVNHIFQSSDGNLYISMYSNLDKYCYETDNFEHIHRKTNQDYQLGIISTIFEDSKNNLWLATNAGLELCDQNLNIIQIYTTQDGLADNTIQAIEEDHKGNLWLSTNNGISKFIDAIHRPDHLVFQNFTMADGLAANDFKSRAALQDKRGYLYFGSSNGYTFFHPDSIGLNSFEPEIVFTDFKILSSTPNKPSTYRTFHKNLNRSNKITLRYPDADFIIEYASLNYLNSQKNQYKFKLEGYDTQWVEAKQTMSATYTNLSEGTYTFKVMGSNNDGIWCQKPKTIEIEIYPPWWKSKIFKVIFGFLLLMLTALFVVLRFSSLHNEKKELETRVIKRTTELSKLNTLLKDKQSEISKQNQELELHRNELEKLVEERTIELVDARSKAEESDRLKTAFLANMSHEIRTPMNAIIGFSGMLVDKDIPSDKRLKYVQQIKTNGKNLNILINDIIDISIIEAQQLVLSKSNFSVDKILFELFHLFEMENQNRFEFMYLNSRRSTDIFIYNDAVRFRQVMQNLLSNAFKYTDKGKIEYGFEVYDTNIQFFVKDTGIGIDTCETKRIFKHFYKAEKDKSKLYRGTGIGLAICKNLVEQMGGKIWLKSKLNEGSTFYFTLPYEKK